MIKATYDGAKCRVLHNGCVSKHFEVHSGVRQGCILSSVLFLIVLDDIISVALSSQSRRCGIQWDMMAFLQHLDYADDICLMSH